MRRPLLRSKFLLDSSCSPLGEFLRDQSCPWPREKTFLPESRFHAWAAAGRYGFKELVTCRNKKPRTVPGLSFEFVVPQARLTTGMLCPAMTQENSGFLVQRYVLPRK